jgi:hypothetical protein
METVAHIQQINDSYNNSEERNKTGYKHIKIYSIEMVGELLIL